jgi:hypothetical protein
MNVLKPQVGLRETGFQDVNYLRAGSSGRDLTVFQDVNYLRVGSSGRD